LRRAHERQLDLERVLEAMRLAIGDEADRPLRGGARQFLVDGHLVARQREAPRVHTAARAPRPV